MFYYILDRICETLCVKITMYFGYLGHDTETLCLTIFSTEFVNPLAKKITMYFVYHGYYTVTLCFSMFKTDIVNP